MNRLFFLIILFLVFSSTRMIAQSKFQLGAKVGAVYTSFSAKEDFKPFYKGGFRPSLNLDLVYEVSDNVFLQTGLGYHHATQQRLNFHNEFLGLRIPLIMGLNLKKKSKSPTLFPFISLGGEMNYILKAVHHEDGKKESLINSMDHWHGGVLIGGGIKRNLKNGQQALIGVYSRLGLTGFPVSKSNISFPKLWPFQLGISFGWRWKMNQNTESKEDKS